MQSKGSELSPKAVTVLHTYSSKEHEYEGVGPWIFQYFFLDAMVADI
jgi:hypothetical protein